MTAKLQTLTGGKPAVQTAEEMADRIREVIDDFAGLGVSLALAVGVLEIVKTELLMESME